MKRQQTAKRSALERVGVSDLAGLAGVQSESKETSKESKGKRRKRVDVRVNMPMPKAAFYVATSQGHILFADDDILSCIRFMKHSENNTLKVFRLSDDLVMAYRGHHRTFVNRAEIERAKATSSN